MNWIDKLARKAVRRRLADLEQGGLTLVEDDAEQVFGDGSGARITVHDQRFWRAIAFGGSVGAAEAYMDGDWTCDDLTEVVRLFVRNREAMDGVEKGWARLAIPIRKLLHGIRRNTRTGARRNVAAHYDLGNEFFSLFLDPTLTYSCGVFENEQSTLEQASIEKYDRLCRKLDLKPGDEVVEIGSGWGGFAIHAATNYGCRVTPTTISKEQHDLARRRIEAAGLSDRVTVLLKDYRELEGRFDKLVSIEMIEQVGHQYYDDYFRKCAELLKPDGIMAIQAITIQDAGYESARKEVDFIKRYIFPGTCIPSVSRLCESMARITDLRLFDLEEIGMHYATTLRKWRENFLGHVDRVLSMGFPREFVRMWDFYFAYCEGGYRERYLGNAQLVFTKPGCRREPLR